MRFNSAFKGLKWPGRENDDEQKSTSKMKDKRDIRPLPIRLHVS